MTENLTDAAVYAAYLENGSSPKRTSEVLGISTATIGRRVRAYRAALAQDSAAEAPQADITTEDAGPENTPAEVDAPATETTPPAGLDAADQAAYAIPCLSPGCGAQPGQPCVSLNRDDEPVTQPYAHPVRIDDAGARPAAPRVILTPANTGEVLASVLAGEITADDVDIEGSTAKLVSVTSEGDVIPAEVIERNGVTIAIVTPEPASVTGSAPVDVTGLITPEIASRLAIEAGAAGETVKIPELTTAPVSGHQCEDPGTCTVDHCVECGWDFGHQQRRHTCGSPRACARRKAAADPTLGRPKAKAEATAA